MEQRNQWSLLVVVVAVVGLFLVIAGSVTLIILRQPPASEPPFLIVQPSPNPGGPATAQAPRPTALPSAPITGRRMVLRAAIPLSSSDSVTPDLLLVNRNYDRSVDTLVYFDSTSRAARWESAPLSNESYQLRIVPAAPRVYIVDKQQLAALSLSDGAQLWTTELSDTISTICRDCLQVVGDYVVALSEDGVLQGFAAQNGERLWSVRLKGTPRQLLVIDNLVATLDLIDAERSGSGAALNLFAPSDGNLVQAIAMTCPDPGRFFPDDRIGIYDQVFFDAASRTLFAQFGTISRCAQRINLANGDLLWRMPLPSGLSALWDRIPPVLTADAIYIGGDGILALSAADGSLRKVAADTDYELSPLEVQDGRLVALAKRTRGSRRYEIWGLDVATGARLWQYVLQGDDRREGPNDSGDWAGWLGGGGFVVVEEREDPDELRIFVLNLADGAVLRETSVNQARPGLSWRGLARTADVAWLTTQQVYALDLRTGDMLYIWPPSADR